MAVSHEAVADSDQTGPAAGPGKPFKKQEMTYGRLGVQKQHGELRQEAPCAVGVESRRAIRFVAIVVGIFFVSSVIGGCAVVTVAGAAVSVAASAVSVAATVVETGVDVGASAVKAVAGSGSASE